MASGSFSLTNTGNTSRYVRIDVNWSSRWSNLSENTSYIDVIVNVVKLPGSTAATSGKYNMTITADNQTITIPNTSFSVSPNKTLEIANVSLPVQHNADGTKSCTLSVNVGGNVMWANGSQYITLDTIPRYATITHSSGAKTETSITMNWNTDASINKLWYSTDNGSTYTEVSNVSGTSGNYTITGLTANTSYNIKTKVRRADSGLESASSTLAVSTYNYPYASQSTSFIIGGSTTIDFYNPLGRTFTYTIMGDDDSTITSATGNITTLNTTLDTTKLYNSIPNKKIGNLKVKVEYGTSTITNTLNTFTINESECIPDFTSITYLDTNNTTTAITGDNQVLISDNSIITFYANGLNGKNGASIVYGMITQGNIYGNQLSTLTINGTTGSASNVVMNYRDTDSKKVQITITDSRGLTYTKEITTGLVAYETPTATFSVKRQSNYYSNTDFLVNANYTQVGTNAIAIRTRQKQEGSDTWSNYTSLTSGTTTTISLDNNYYWNIEIELSDALNTKTYTTTIQRGMPVFYIDTLKNSLGVNCFPQYENDIEVSGSPINSRYDTTAVACGDFFGNTLYRYGERGDLSDIETLIPDTRAHVIWQGYVDDVNEIVDYSLVLYDEDSHHIYKCPFEDLSGNKIIAPYVSYMDFGAGDSYFNINFWIDADIVNQMDTHSVKYYIVFYFTKTQG